MRAPLAASFAIAFGVLVLLGYVYPADLPGAALVSQIRSVLVGWAAILAGVAALVGVVNLVFAHWGRLTARKNPDRYSLLVILFFLATVGLGIYERVAQPEQTQFQQAILAVQVPVEAALMGMLAVTLTFASVRLFQRRKGLMASVFILSALFFLLLGSGLLAPLRQIPAFSVVLDLIQQFPVAGGRGILLGIALGSLTAGLRVLIGADRPYSG
jgi:membrane-associated HD superfamily phosphohydrolase